MRLVKGAALAGFAALVLTISMGAGVAPATAQDRSAHARAGTVATDMSAQARRDRRPVTRLRVERYQRLPPTAVRTCDAWYAQEHRPSGTVIVPKMSCRWVNG